MANSNPQKKGAKADKLIRDALLGAIRQSPEKLKCAAESVLDRASCGDQSAMQFLADRIDGKAVQPISHDFSEDQQNDDGLDAQLLNLIRKAGIAITSQSEALAENEGGIPSVH
jgi:hypothetical protein